MGSDSIDFKIQYYGNQGGQTRLILKFNTMEYQLLLSSMKTWINQSSLTPLISIYI